MLSVSFLFSRSFREGRTSDADMRKSPNSAKDTAKGGKEEGPSVEHYPPQLVR